MGSETLAEIPNGLLIQKLNSKSTPLPLIAKIQRQEALNKI